MKNKTLKVLALGGLLGPILFTVTTLICGAWRPDYSHLHNFISELGASDTSRYQLMNIMGFIPSGLFLCSFGFSMLIVTSKHLIPKIGATLIMMFGIGVTLAGVYSCDEGCPPSGSVEAAMHDSVSAMAFFSAIIGMIMLGFSFIKSTTFKRFSIYTLFSGVAAALFMMTMISTFESRVYTGLWQRLLLLTIFIWTSVIGLYIYKSHTSQK
ncbi:MAG: DUF998 domain-containing protein [Cyclobacteriaceae bacterium]